jgi:hypothetical protein
VIVSELSPADGPVLSVATRAVYESNAGLDRMARVVLGWSRRQSPTAFDSALGSLTPQLTLVVLNGVAAGAFDDRDAARGGSLSAWWARRRLARRLRRRRAPDGADTVVPVLAVDRAARIADEARRLAGRAGLAEEEAARFAARLSAVLSDAPATRSPG